MSFNVFLSIALSIHFGERHVKGLEQTPISKSIWLWIL